MIYYGENANMIYYGANECQGIYYGSELIYPNTITGVKVTSKANFSISGGTKTIKVRADRDWTITYDTSKTWITSVSPLTGTAGTTEVTIVCGQNPGQTVTDTLTVTTNDSLYSATCTIKSLNFPESFLINFNAKNFNSATNTLMNKEGASLNWNCEINSDYIAGIGNDYVTVNVGSWGTGSLNSKIVFANPASNPFNSDNLTIIFKTGPDNNTWICSNRSSGGTFRWRIFGGSSSVNVSDGKAEVSFSTKPNIIMFRGTSSTYELKSITDNISTGVVNQSAYLSGQTETAFNMFHGGYGNERAENLKFYWMFITDRVLTDDEVQAVIDYNENL